MRPFICSLLAWFVWLPMSLADDLKIRVRSLNFSPDGDVLAAAAGDKDGRVVIWDTKTGAALRELSFAAPSVVRFFPDGKTLAVAAANKVEFWDVSSGKSVGELAHPKPVVAVAFGPAGKLATSANDGIVRVWDMIERKELAQTTAYREGFVRLAYSPDGKSLAGADKNQAYQWDAASGKEERKFDDGGMYTAGACFTADGALLLRCIGNMGTVQVSESVSGKLRSTFDLRGGKNYFDFAPACEVVAASSSFSDSEPIVTVQALRFTPLTDAEQKRIDELLKKLDADKIQVRDAAGEELLRLGGLVEPVLAKAMSESTSAEVRLRARKLRIQLTSHGSTNITAPKGQITAIALSGDGKRLAVGGLTGAVHILGVPGGKLIRTLQLSKP
jgi:WD40 repeat protein